jgi:hypothetical protein
MTKIEKLQAAKVEMISKMDSKIAKATKDAADKVARQRAALKVKEAKAAQKALRKGKVKLNIKSF